MLVMTDKALMVWDQPLLAGLLLPLDQTATAAISRFPLGRRRRLAGLYLGSSSLVPSPLEALSFHSQPPVSQS